LLILLRKKLLHMHNKAPRTTTPTRVSPNSWRKAISLDSRSRLWKTAHKKK